MCGRERGPCEGLDLRLFHGVGHVSGGALPAENMEREGSRQDDLLPAPCGLRGGRHMGAGGICGPVSAPERGGIADRRRAVADDRLSPPGRLYGRVRRGAEPPRPAPAAGDIEGLPLRCLRRDLHGAAGAEPVERGHGGGERSPAAAAGGSGGVPGLRGAGGLYRGFVRRDPSGPDAGLGAGISGLCLCRDHLSAAGHAAFCPVLVGLAAVYPAAAAGRQRDPDGGCPGAALARPGGLVPAGLCVRRAGEPFPRPASAPSCQGGRLMRRVLESFCAECAVLAASRGARSIFIVGILFYSLLYPSPYFYEVPQDLPFFAVDQDGSTSSRQLLRSLDATEGIRLHRYADLGQAFADLRSGTMVGGIVIPRDFERGLLRGQETAVPFYSEAAHLLSYGMLVQGGRLATENLGAGARVERLRKQGVPESAALALQVRGRIDARLLYNPAGNYASNTVPPVFVLILQQIMVIGCAMLAVTRKERFPGTAGGMAAAAGRLLLSLCLGLIFAFYYLFVLQQVDDLLPVRDFAALLFFLLPFFSVCHFLGGMLGEYFSREHAVLLLMLPTSIPFLFLSGTIWPLQAMPLPLACLAQLVPATPAISGYMLMAFRGATLADVLHFWGQLLLLNAVVLAARQVQHLLRAGVPGGPGRISVPR